MNALITAVLIASSSMTATPEVPSWNPDYGIALEATKAAAKPLLVLIDRPADPEQGSQEAVLRSDNGLGEVLAGYTLCYVDATTEYGQRVAQAFSARQFPFAAVIDRQGKRVVSRWTGTRDAAQWSALLGGSRLPSGPMRNGHISNGGAQTVRAQGGRAASSSFYAPVRTATQACYT
jgi:hypothetical protein